MIESTPLPQQVLLWQRFDGRYYGCHLQQNLFGEWILIRRWGTSHSRRGRSIETRCQSYEEGLEQLAAVAQRRKQRGYQVMEEGKSKAIIGHLYR